MVPLAGLVFLLGFILLASANAMFVPLNPNIPCATVSCVLVRTFSEYQTLFGAGLAVLAAFVAARPAWLQLQKMKLQQDITARDAILQRLKGIEARAKYQDDKIQSLIQEILRNIYLYPEDENYDPSTVDVHWAFDKMHECQGIALKLKSFQASMRDTHSIEEARQNVIHSLEQLRACFCAISAPAAHAGDPEVSSEDEERMRYAEAVALEQLPQKVDDLANAMGDFSSIILEEKQFVRRRLRQIDDDMLGDA